MAREALGLELREDCVRALALRLQRMPVVLGYGWVEVASGEDVHAQTLTALQTALREPVEGKLTLREAYVSLPESKVFRKIIELPHATLPEELRQKIGEEIASFLPGELDTMEFDFQFLPPSFFAKPDPEIRHVAVVATEKRIVQDILALTNEAKLRLKALDTAAAALARSLLAPDDAEPALVIAAETNQINVALIQQAYVWATGVVRGSAAEDPTGLAVAVADEIAHVTKFYANRSGVSKLPKRILLASGFPADFKKKLGEEVDGVIKEGKTVIELKAGLDAAVVLGAALYSLYQQAPEVA